MDKLPRMTLHLPPSTFLRLAPLLAALLLATGAPPAAAAPDCAPVLLVQGTASTPNRAERDYAASVARRLTRWLTELNVPFKTLSDEEVTAEAVASARVVVLGYSPFPPRAEQDVLRAFAEAGGKIIVFYGGDPSFAAWMGLRMGPASQTAVLQSWRQMHFLPDAPPHVPVAVAQESRISRPVYPAAARTRIIATWQRESGDSGGEPAWLQSPRGFWMTHVLLDDGDSDNKKQLLLALLGACDPAVWKPAADGALQRAGQIGRFKSVAEAVTAITREGAGASREGPARALLGQAADVDKVCRRLYAEGKYAETVLECRKANRLLLLAYGMIQRPRPGERRGVWDHGGTGLYPGDWGRTCGVLAESGITDVFVNMLWPWQAHYPSRIVAPSAVALSYGDQLESSVRAAHARGLRVHLWKLLWRMDRAPAAELARLKKENRLQVSVGGETFPWLCPSNVENLQLEKNAVREAVKNYAIDGVHLDYVRYPDSSHCFCTGCRKNFEAWRGRTVAQWPRDVAGGALTRDYRRWRCAQITRLVRDVAALVRSVRPGVQISAAVYGKYPSCVDSVGQDWASWLQEGIVDFVCPMDYTPDLGKFSSYVKAQVSLPAGKGRIWPGIGVTAAESTIDPAQVVDQVNVARQAGAPGFVLFALNQTLEREVFPVLRLGVTAGRESPLDGE
jgi:uncharacterized lipoprotein YddW (UPF0748 family)